MSLIEKRPGWLKRKFGVDAQGNGPVRPYLKNWMGDSLAYSIKAVTSGAIAIPVIAGIVVYAGAQIYEHDFSNERPPMPYEEADALREGTTASRMTVFNDTGYGRVAGFDSGENQPKGLHYLAVQDPVSGYELYTCGNQDNRDVTCRLLREDDVRELALKFEQWAEDQKTTADDPAFFFPHKETFVSKPVRQEKYVYLEDGLETETVPSRIVRSTHFTNANGYLRRLSELDTGERNAEQAFWRAVFNSPENGTYNDSLMDAEIPVWKRIEGQEWDDALLGHGVLHNVIGGLALMMAGVSVRSLFSAAARTRDELRPLSGLAMLDHKKTVPVDTNSRKKLTHDI